MTRTRRTGLLLALVAALVLLAVVAAGRSRSVTESRPQGRGQWWSLVAVG